MLSYAGLHAHLASIGMDKTDLAAQLGISARTISQMDLGEKLPDETLQKMADSQGCSIDALCREVPPNAILQLLREEKSASISGGLYHELQVRMTYHSNHIEGCKLTEEQTRLIFETDTLYIPPGEQAVPVDDILETVHHFRAIDYVIDIAEAQLTEEIIQHMHRILKRDTRDSTLAWVAAGDYKRRANSIGGRETVPPEHVPARMRSLLTLYKAKPTVTIEDVIAFHAEFEHIHPFQDGNGRVGRLVALKECLHHGIVPFLIEDDKKLFYYRGLSEWRRDKAYLIDTCLDGQDTVIRLLHMLGIPHA